MSTKLASPPPETSVRVSTANLSHTYAQPDIVSISPTKIKRSVILWFSANVWIDQPGGSSVKVEKLKTVSIVGLCAISPIVKAAVEISGLELSDIDHIILPFGHLEAYDMLFKWFDGTTLRGNYRHLEPEYDSPLFKYHHLLEIAEKLRITPILENLGPRYSVMLAYEKGINWNVNPNDLRRVYSELPAHHALRLAIVKGIALVWYHNSLGGKKRKEIEQITWEIPELWDDLNSLWQGFERNES